MDWLLSCTKACNSTVSSDWSSRSWLQIPYMWCRYMTFIPAFFYTSDNHENNNININKKRLSLSRSLGQRVFIFISLKMHGLLEYRFY